MRDIEKRVRCNLFDFIFIVAFFFCWRQNQLTNPHTIPHPLCIRQRLRLCAPAFEYEYEYDPNRLRFLQQIQLQRGSGCTNNNCHANWRHPTPWQHNWHAFSASVSIFFCSPSSLLFSSLPFPATFEVPLQMCMTTVINFCLSFVFAPPSLPTSLLPYSLPPCLPHRVLLRLWQAFVLWHRQPRQNVGRPCIVYTWDANSSFCYALEIFY